MSLERVPPHNNEAEVTVIASLLLDEEGDALTEIVAKLSPDHFYRQAHKDIIAAVLNLASKGEPVNLVFLKKELERNGKLEAVGGTAYLASLTQGSVAAIVNIEKYYEIIQNQARLRKMIKVCNEILDMCFTNTEDSQEIIDRSESLVLAAAEERYVDSQVMIKDVVKPTMNNIEQMWLSKGELTGIPSGYQDLDEMTRGFQDSNLIVLAARPSMGKTALALNIAANAALKHKKKVLIFSLEMSSMQLVQRIICSESRISAWSIQKGKLSTKDWHQMTNAASAISEANIWIDDNASMSYMDIRSKSRRTKTKDGLDLIIVDYLQLINLPPGMGASNKTRTNEIADISRNLKILAMELKIPVLTLSQLNRKIEDRKDPVPMLSDLRDSGAIEQDADVVTFLHRPEYYQADKFKKSDEENEFSSSTAQQAKEAEIIIAKQRNGPVGTVKLTFLPDIMKFENFIQREKMTY